MKKKKQWIVSDYNQEAIDSFIKNRIANGDDGVSTNYSYDVNIRRVLATINKDYDNITKSDLDDVFANIKEPGTRELAKTRFKPFLKYHNLGKLADHIHVNTKYFKKPLKTSNDILTKEEIHKIINSTLSTRDKAIFELFVTTGICREEFVELIYQNIEIHPEYIRIHIAEGKTPFRPRTIDIIVDPNNVVAFFPKNFVSYYHNFPFVDDNQHTLFYSMSSKNMGDKLNKNSLTLFFRKVMKQSKITKNITPHILRHTGATYDGYHMTEAELRAKYGWGINSTQPKRYCHMDEEKFTEHRLLKLGLTPDKIKEESECPYCETINNINQTHCINCKRVIRRKLIIEENKKSDEKIDKLTKYFEEQINDLKLELDLLSTHFGFIEKDGFTFFYQRIESEIEDGSFYYNWTSGKGPNELNELDDYDAFDILENKFHELLPLIEEKHKKNHIIYNSRVSK